MYESISTPLAFRAVGLNLYTCISPFILQASIFWPVCVGTGNGEVLSDLMQPISAKKIKEMVSDKSLIEQAWVTASYIQISSILIKTSVNIFRIKGTTKKLTVSLMFRVNITRKSRLVSRKAAGATV